MSITSIARDAGIAIALEGYHAPADDGKTITAPEDHPHGAYDEGDLVEPFDMSNAHLRIAAAYRTPAGRISAEAKRAQQELTRRKVNRPIKAARQSLVVAALLEAGLLDD